MGVEESHPSTHSRLLLVGILLAVWPMGQVCCRAEADRVSCFVFGNVHPIINPFVAYFDEDPQFTCGLEPIPSGLNDEQRRKYDRLYFPRTRSILLSYEMYFFADARIQHFSPRQWHDLEFAFRDGGVASFYSFGPAWFQAMWGSVLHPVIPVVEYSSHFHKPFRVIFSRQRDPVFIPFIELGIENVVGDAYGIMVPRQGAKEWARMQPLDLPWLVSWKPGGADPGETWVLADELNNAWWATALAARNKNPYAIDLVLNMVLYSVNRPLISDIQARREARHVLYEYRTQKLLVLSMMEWADMFGANTLPITASLADLDDNYQEAITTFLEQDYARVIGAMATNSEAIMGLTREALRLKDEALFWVYVIEWMVVTAAAMISGLLVWGLMIRRALYKKTSTTRTQTRSRLLL